ncbi:hypothetical protein KCP74_06050 [Salmonella enterica subsp. enterica]|nr:hypothetical protein KCP74_06050 [Salmonella enterica subsp. enterica]
MSVRMRNESEILSVKEKIGYGMGVPPAHIIFDNVMLYMMFAIPIFFGIPASTLVWACWPTAPAFSLGQNSDHRCCLARCRLRHRLCAGL